MRGIIENIRGSEYVRNVSVLASGTIIVQVISTLISPVLSRLYTPDDYGTLALFTSCISVLTVIGSFRYELAILIPKKYFEAELIFKLSLVITFLVSIVVLLVTTAFNQNITAILGNENLSLWLYFIAPVFLAAGITQSFTYWFNRNKNYKIISGVRIYQSSINSGLSLILGLLKFNAFGLILSLIISQITSSLYLLKKSLFRFNLNSFNFFKLKSVGKQYREFPLLSLPSALLDTVSINAIIFLLSYFFSESVTGAYSFALRILSIPAIVIGSAMGQVFFQKISEAYGNNEKITGLILKLWKVLFLIGILPTVVLFFFGKELFTFVFGANWAEAGNISKYLCILTFFMFISSPTSSAMIVLRKQKILLFVNIAAFIYRPLALFWGYSINSYLKGILLYIILEIIQILCVNFLLLKSAREADLKKE
ncbi:MAG: oligosaccharide flippase family protein [bacterium]